MQRNEVTLGKFQNMTNPKYIEVVFGKQDITSVFSKYRKPFKKQGMAKNKNMKLVDRAIEMILNDSLSDNTYIDEMMNEVNILPNLTAG
ncbi:MAG: hypothetical protein ACYCR7_04810 [Thermoplasmataceae archaeon]